MSFGQNESVGSVPTRQAPSWTAWALSCCGLCGESRAYGYGQVEIARGGKGDFIDDDDHVASNGSGRGRRRSGRTGRGKGHGAVFTIDVDDEDGDVDLDLDDALINELLDSKEDEEEPEKRQAAAQLVKGVCGALERGDYSDSFAGRLTKTESDGSIQVKILFEPIGLQGVESLARSLRNNTDVTSVELGINQVETGDSKLPHLCALVRTNATLRTLSLWGNGVTDYAASLLAECLEHNSTLHTLNLNNNDIGDRGLACLTASLKENTALRVLDLSGNNMIADSGASAAAADLVDNRGLSTLNLSSNSITTAGAIKFAELIGEARNTTLTSIDLSSNLITDEGIIALALAVPKNAHLQQLSLHGNIISGGGEQAVKQAQESRKAVIAL